MNGILRRHWRFLSGLVAGIAAAIIAPAALMEQLLIGADVLFAVYLGTTLAVVRHLTPPALCHHAGEDDEGVAIILLLGLLAVAASLAAIFGALNAADATVWQRAGALLSVPLGWLTLHTLFAFHYAHLWYAPAAAHPARHHPRRGLDFAGGTDAPGPGDFLYHSLTIGMTAQTSDTAVTTTVMRRLTLVHAVISFFYNTVLIALAVSAGLSGR